MSEHYDVYGIGNALVDIQYQIEPAFLERNDIEKGVMTLIDEDRQRQLLSELEGGPAKRSSGGSAANTVIGVAGFGGSAYYGCKVADDDDGAFYLDDLKAAGVGCNAASRYPGITGKCLVMITADADRTMNTFLGITSTFGPEQVEADVVADSRVIYIEGYLLSSDSGFEAARSAQRLAKDSGKQVTLTLSDPFIVGSFGERVDSLLDAGVDLLFCNDAEAQACTGVDDVEAACAALADRVGRYAVTCGADGARVGDRDGSIHAPGFSVDAVDTNGAGDMFAGAFLFGMTNGYDTAQSAKLATYASSRVVASYGPRLDVRLVDEIDDILAM
jgi:sugar/nucleoside kinase (ribokinase family)